MFNDIPDHPVIQNMERTGYPDGKEPEYPHCPVCGAETDTVYSDGVNVVGCPECLMTMDAWEEEECFPDKEDR